MTRLERDNQTQIPPSSASETAAPTSGAPAWVARARVSRWTIGGVAAAVMAVAALLAWQAERDMEPTAYPTAEALRTIGERAVADSVKVGQAEQARQAAVRGEAAGRRPAQAFRDCEECPEMVVVPAGSYMMGSPASEAGRYADESPQHGVTIGYSLAVGVYEVTFAEWEYVARAGTETAWYWGREAEGARCLYENGGNEVDYAGIPAPNTVCFDGFADIAPVGSFLPNPWGLYDMLGNAPEWTEDCWHDSYEGAPSDGSAWLCPEERDLRVRVGRGYSSVARFSLPAARYAYRAMGFRVARTID